jgi:LuxR family transcriptional regulator, maltose regulon positive regulatory protein
VAWLSLERSDSQPASYWTYLITALQAVVPGVGGSALQLLQSAQPPIETVLATVLNELGAAPNDLYLVLDDYHLVDNPEVQGGMTFLLEHLPPQAHLVVSTREDPALPLVEEVLGRQPADVRGFLTDHTRQTGPRRAAERTRAGRAAAARLRPRRPRHRP